jgi:hypothetical protein
VMMREMRASLAVSLRRSLDPKLILRIGFDAIVIADVSSYVDQPSVR